VSTSRHVVPASMQPDQAPATVLFIHSSDDLYGSDHVLLQIVRGLDPTLYKPLVVLPTDMEHVGLLSRELRRYGVEYVHLPIAIMRRRYMRPLSLPAFLGRVVKGTLILGRLIKARQVKLIYGFTFAVVAAPAVAAWSGVPLITHAHEIMRRPSWLRKLLNALYVRRSKAVLCISEAVRLNILQDEPRSARRLPVIHNGLARRDVPEKSVAAWRTDLGVPLEMPLAGMAGRVSQWKGQEILLRAAAILVQRAVPCHFLSIGGVFDGDESYRSKLNNLMVELGMREHFTMVDFRPDARYALAALDIFILPSIEPEPFGMVILEAMAAGRPVVASKHGGPLEIVLDGTTGLLVAPSDPEALANAIQELLQDAALRDRMGQAGAQRLDAEFSIDSQLRAIQSVFSSVLQASGQ
jgi:glycosyltransferase involved in cell wall biosynthesis